MIPPLLAHQERALDWLAEHPKGWLALEQGLGKTRTVIEEDVYPCEIVVPAFLRANWKREIERWRDGARVHFVTGKSGYDKHADFNIVSYDATPGMIPPVGIRRIIFDESHFLGNPRAKRTKAGRARAKTTTHVRMLSGTPDPNRPMELWAMASAIGMTRLTWREWGFQYCAGRIGRWGGYDFSGASHRDELRRLFGEWAFRLTKREALQLPKSMRRLIVLGTKPDMRERDYDIGEIMRNPNPLSFVGLAEVLHEHGKRKVPQALEYIQSVMQDVRPVLIGAKHKAVVQALYDGLKEQYAVATMTGDTQPFQRDDIVQRFKAGKLDAIIGNARAMGVGVDGLQERCHYGIMVEADWSDAVNKQFEARLDRMGQHERVQWDYLVCDRSIDARIIEKCIWKEDFAADITGDRIRASVEDLF